MQQRESLLAIAKIKLVEDRLHHLLSFCKRKWEKLEKKESV